MKDETIAFQKLAPQEQNRVEERISFLYLEYAKVRQTEAGVTAFSTGEEGEFKQTHVPVANLAVLELGPGTSISTAAITSAARSGCTVMFTQGGGFPELSTITPLTSSAKWALAQAQVSSQHSAAKIVASDFYAKMFGVELTGSINQMRGLEGSLMRKVYQTEARKYGLKHFKRNTDGDDGVNVALNIVNGLLYGLGATAVRALGMNPALGVIHRGRATSLLFDIADWYKPKLSIPIAFSASQLPREEVPSFARKELRKKIMAKKLLKDVMETLQECYSPYLPTEQSFEDYLIDDKEGQAVEGGYNHEKEGSISLL